MINLPISRVTSLVLEQSSNFFSGCEIILKYMVKINITWPPNTWKHKLWLLWFISWDISWKYVHDFCFSLTYSTHFLKIILYFNATQNNTQGCFTGRWILHDCPSESKIILKTFGCSSVKLAKLPRFAWMKSFLSMIKIWLKFAPEVLIVNNPALVKIMAWHRIGNKPLSEAMMIQFTDTYMRH